MSLSGKITSLTPDNITGTYQNAQGQVSTHVQVRILRQTSPNVFVVAQQSPLISKTVNPGEEMNITWSETEFVALDVSQDYAIEFQITDALSTVGAWGGRSLFHTNYRPLTPGNLTPANNAIMTGAPNITFNASDQDDTAQSLGGNLEAWAEITGPYIINGTFDVDATGWSDGSASAGITVTRARATDQARNGAGSYKHDITANTSPSLGTVLSQSGLHPAVEGYSYTASVWRRTNLSTLVGVIAFAWYDESDSFVDSSFNSAVSVVINTWQQITVNGTAPSGATQFRIILQSNVPAAATGSVWFDDASVSSSVRGLVEAVKVGSANGWQATPTIDMVSAAGQYVLRARSYDQDLYSNWSPSASFTMSVGPEVEIISPTSLEEIETSRPLIEWDLTGTQNRYRVILRDGVTDDIRHDSNYITESVARSYVIPASIVRPVDSLTVQVVIENEVSLTGYSPLIKFSVLYPAPPAPTDLNIGLQSLWGDDHPSAIRLGWTPVDTASDLLVGMEIWRMENSKPETKSLIAIYEGYDPGYYLDTTARSGVNYRYFVRQSARQSGFERYGEEAFTDASITLKSAVLEEVGNEEDSRVVLKLWSARSVTLTQQQSWVMASGATDYTETLSYGIGRDISVTWQVLDSTQYGGSSGLTAREQIEALERIYDTQVIMSWRDGMGRQDYFRFNGNVVINDKNKGAAKNEVTIPLRRIDYIPAQVVNVN